LNGAIQNHVHQAEGPDVSWIQHELIGLRSPAAVCHPIEWNNLSRTFAGRCKTTRLPETGSDCLFDTGADSAHRRCTTLGFGAD